MGLFIFVKYDMINNKLKARISVIKTIHLFLYWFKFKLNYSQQLRYCLVQSQ